jgi:hypothetical protein
MMEAVRTFETLVNFHEATRRNTTEDCHLTQRMVEWLILLLRIREVPGSYLDPETGYPEIFCAFSK